MTALITGATGTVGALVTERLLARGERPRVFVRDAKRARSLFGARVDVRVGDLGDAGSVAAALDGVDALFLLNVGVDLAARDGLSASAARAAGVRHVVKLSTLDVSLGVGTGPWHALGELAIQESGVPYTFIRAAGFMTNALGWAHPIRQGRVLRSSTGEGRIAFIDPEDIADVAAHALTVGRPENETWVVTGPEALSYRAMVAIIGDALGATIRYEPISDAAARKVAMGWAEGPEYAEAVVDIWRAVREGRTAVTTDGVRRVLGRAAKPFRRWVEENRSAFGPAQPGDASR